MKKAMVIFFSPVLAFCGLVLVSCGSPAYCFIYDRIAAVVNDEVIISSDINKLLNPIYEQYTRTYSGEALKEKMLEARREALDVLIENELFYQEAQKYKIEVDKSEIDMRINEIKARFSSEQDFLSALENDNMTVEKYRQNIREQIMIKRLIGYFVTSRVVVTPDEVEEYYNHHLAEFHRTEQVKFDLITLKDVPGEKPAMEKAEEIIKLLEDKKTSSEIEEYFKEDEYLHVKENMGFYSKGRLLSEIEESAFALEIGQYSSPFAIGDEIYVVVLTDKIIEGVMPLREVYSAIENKMIFDAVKIKKVEFVDDLKEKAYISYK